MASEWLHEDLAEKMSLPWREDLGRWCSLGVRHPRAALPAPVAPLLLEAAARGAGGGSAASVHREACNYCP